MLNRHIMENGYLTVGVKPEGAELCSLIDAAGNELLWQAGEAWRSQAPNLFPIVGELNGGQYRHNGKTYRMVRHGFARRKRFAWLQRTPTRCRLVLHDDAETRAEYPFGFRFEIGYALDDDALEITFTVTNTGRTVLPASCGGHPAFVWPLAEGVEKSAHRLEFSDDEGPMIRRIDANGLILPEPLPSPIAGRMLMLDRALFEADAIILDRLQSSSVRYSAPGAPSIEVSWDGFRQLGIWQKLGADFICIEPWHGHADPQGYDGELLDKPGMMLIPPGEKRVLTHRVRVC
jgi:galactose mutarotase-like enzyme